ncbi:MAG: tRNA (N6-isopentenyl adenosine(37)-C2)-methylthiotransferase MiaB [candidate division Zixibacteria bacterium]|nr:tRNA (N6-isopentenyl adenosine(37)-C2)-methylthiotransferase MiaB [candidate division Zixibacteria bacterium]
MVLKNGTYKIVTFGCQMNLADSGVLAAILNAHGYRAVETEQDAEVIILNTCSVRQKAEDRVFGRLGELLAIKRRNGVKIAVVGCMAQRMGDEILERAPYVDFVLGTDRLYELPGYLANGEPIPSIHTDFGYEHIDGIVPERDSPYSAFVTISRGCDNFCTYCIVPYVRGRERSYPVDRIVGQVRDFVADGVLEVTLLGQNVNSYRDGDSDFADLLKAVASQTDIRRIRFMTSHPKDLSDKLIEVLATEPKMMTHFHLPLQSGSDRILQKMGRGYTFAHYHDRVRTLREVVPDISITTDLIVGFPSETEEEFRMTLDAVREIRYDSSFMFRYSVREGTAAARLIDDVPEPEKIRRLTELITLQKTVSYEKNQEEVGLVREVLVDGVSRRDPSVVKGKTEGNKTLLFKAGPEYIGTIQKVNVITADSWTLHGEPVK